MYLPLGASAAVPFDEIVGVFDLDNVSYAYRSREFLRRREEAGGLHTLGSRIPLSLVVTARDCYLSPVSPAALTRRLTEETWD